MEKKRIVVACGGTGGHAFPGLAAAAEMRARGHEVSVWTSGRSIESSVMKSWDGPTFSTGAKTLSPGHLPAILLSVLRCRREIGRFKPHALLAMGSYSSLPPVLAAASRRVPVVLHEANAVPGRAVDFLSRLARVVAISFPSAAECFSGRRTELTGLPVRREIAEGTRFDDFPPDRFTVFVTGGSQGAHRVNEIAAQALALVKHDLDKTGDGAKLRVIHQTGFADEGAVTGRYAAAGVPARVQAFEREMGRAFATADLVIARAGASTCFELALCGKPAFLIPLPSALRNHQHWNADAFASVGAADEGLQAQLAPRQVCRYLLERYDRPELLARMAGKMKAQATPDAAAKVADLIEQGH